MDELVTIAGALQILTTGTNPELIERMRDHSTQAGITALLAYLI